MPDTAESCFQVPTIGRLAGGGSRLLAVEVEGGEGGGDEDGGHDGERGDDGDFQPRGDEHFDGDEGEQGGEAVVEQAQAVKKAGEGEEERAQAEDGGDV